MNPTHNIAIAATLSAILSIAGLGTAHAVDAAQTMKPLQGVSFHAGDKHAAAYFLSDDAACKLVLTLANEGQFAPSRFETAIATGAAVRYQLAEGKTLEFACRAGAQELAVTSLQATASN